MTNFLSSILLNFIDVIYITFIVLAGAVFVSAGLVAIGAVIYEAVDALIRYSKTRLEKRKEDKEFNDGIDLFP